MTKYSVEEKTKALMLLKRYDFNKTRVCKELGIRFETITSWVNSDLGKRVLKQKDPSAPQTGTGVTKEVDKIVSSTVKDFREREASLDELIFDTKKVILNRIKEIAPSLKNAYALAALLTAMKDFDAPKEQSQVNNNFLNFIQQQIIPNEGTNYTPIN